MYHGDEQCLFSLVDLGVIFDLAYLDASPERKSDAGVLTTKTQLLLHHFIAGRRPPLALLYDHLLPCKCLVPSHHKSISYPKFIKIHNTLLRPPPPALPPQQTCELTPAPQMAPSHMSLQHTDQTLQHAFMGDVASQEGEKQDRASDSEAPKPRHQFSVSEEGLDEGAAGRGHGEEGQGGCCCCMCRRASVIEGECAQ